MSFARSIVSIMLLGLLGSVASAQDKPNVVYILVDNWGWGDIALLKVHFFTAEGTFSPIVQPTFPQVYDIKNDPGETRELWQSEGYSHLWVMKPVMEILSELSSSQQQYPNIKPGQEFSGNE
jgi:hypothetical protein